MLPPRIGGRGANSPSIGGRGAALALLSFLAVLSAPAGARTVSVRGKMNTAVTVVDRRVIQVPSGVNELKLLVPVYPSMTAGPNTQQIDASTTTFSTDPNSRRLLHDRYGNAYLEAIWKRPVVPSVAVKIHSRVQLSLQASPSAPVAYPLNRSALPANVLPYLGWTPQVQVDSAPIREIADQIRSDSNLADEAAVVNAVISWVVDHISYKPDHDCYDALTTLANHSGECTGYSHLALAILRRLGIPARFVAGICFEQPYRVTGPGGTYQIDDQRLSGFLYHAWIQVYFPGQGWIQCDPQGDFGLVDTRRVVLAVGPDKDTLPEGRFITTEDPLDDPSSFSEESSATVNVDSDTVDLVEEPAAVTGPSRDGVYMMLASD